MGLRAAHYTWLDRPARSTPDLPNTLAAIAEKGAAFRSLGVTWAGTTTADGRLMLTIRLYRLRARVDPCSRARRTRARQGKGREDGAKPKLTEHQKREVNKRRGRGDETLAEIAALTT
ncbi:MAG TPA: hypothetical protein VME69_10780 [Methylocella sp.]|nr:hypothetical protein [Methylocella sp.]